MSEQELMSNLREDPISTAIAAKEFNALPRPQTDSLGAEDPDAGSGGLLRGHLLKFGNSGTWLDTVEGAVVGPDQQFLVCEEIKACEKWGDRRVVERRIMALGEAFPDVERLNLETPREQWREFCGVPKGPWQNTRYIYLYNPQYGAFTWAPSTIGASMCMRDLKAELRRARHLHGKTNLYPIVTLHAVVMKTAYGDRQRPAFKVLGFATLGEPTGQPTLNETPAPPMNDKIPY
jgi:hypothetical protein